MPVVRRLQPQVDLAPLPGVRKTAAATPESEGAGVARARGTLEATKALGSAKVAGVVAGIGDQLTAIATSEVARMRDEERKAADQTALLKASNALSDWKNKRLYDAQAGAFTLKGEAALPLPEQIRGEFDKVAGDIEGTLTTPTQKAAWARLRSQEWQSTDLEVQRHVFGEIQTYRAGELKSFVENGVNAAGQSFQDPKTFAMRLGQVTSAIRSGGPSLGLGPEMIDAQIRAVTSKAHVDAISNLLAADQVQSAQAWFTAAKDQIDADQQDNIVKALDVGTTRKAAQKEADAIVLAGGTLSEQRDKAKTIENADVRDEALRYVEHEWAIKEKGDRDAEEASMRTSYDILDRTHTVTKIPSNVWATYDGSTRAAMIAYADRRTKGAPVETDPTRYYALLTMAGDKPDAFVKENLLKYRNVLDDGDFKQLAGLQLSIKNGDRTRADKDLAPVRTRNQIFTDTMLEASIVPDTPESAKLHRELDRRVEQWQTDTGKAATNDQVQTIMDALVQKVVLTPATAASGGFLGFFQTPGQAAVTKRAADLTIEDVPPADRTRIEAKLRAEHQPVTPDSVVNWYLRIKRLAGEVK